MSALIEDLAAVYSIGRPHYFVTELGESGRIRKFKKRRKAVKWAERNAKQVWNITKGRK